MKLGFFTMPVHPPERTYWQTLKEDRDAFILADQLGYTEGYCGAMRASPPPWAGSRRGWRGRGISG